MSSGNDKKYFLQAKFSQTSSLLLFHGITHTKQGEKLQSGGGLSYTWMRELFLSNLKELGFDTKQFSLHNLRAGGVTTAANAGVLDHLFKRHGHWRSELAKDGYVKDNQEALSSVSWSLEL